ncbi:hypothetical protein L6R52_33335, partial [Myxococcota bacterium]|nr:hypothetical protein [Myxococcota bacterium]
MRIVRTTAVIVAVIVTGACAVPDAGDVLARCPCIDGYVCCEALDVCLPEGDTRCGDDGEAPVGLAIVGVTPSEGPVHATTPIELEVAVADPVPAEVRVDV